jgi:hypothetical protein
MDLLERQTQLEELARHLREATRENPAGLTSQASRRLRATLRAQDRFDFPGIAVPVLAVMVVTQRHVRSDA